MGKPSIFSKDYEKLMRKRRRKITLSIMVVILLATALLIRSDISNWVNKGKEFSYTVVNKFKGKENKDIKKSDKTVQSSSKVNDEKIHNTVVSKKNEEKTVINQQDKGKDEFYDVKLSDAQSVRINYENRNNNISLKSIVEPSNDINYDISPNKKNIVICNKKNQDLILVDIKKNIKNITKKEYISSSGKTFTKEEQLKKRPDYIWCTLPRFIDEDNIVYISNLPWISKKNIQYIWMVNTKSNEHKRFDKLSGKNIVLGNINAKGIKCEVDGTVFYLDGKGTISN